MILIDNNNIHKLFLKNYIYNDNIKHYRGSYLHNAIKKIRQTLCIATVAMVINILIIFTFQWDYINTVNLYEKS